MGDMTVTDNNIDIYSRDFQQNIFEYNEVLRKQGNVVYLSKSNCFVVTAFNQVKQVLDDSNYSTAQLKNVDTVLLGADDAQHAGNKKAVIKNIPCLHSTGVMQLNDYAVQIFNLLYKNMHVTGDNNLVEALINPFTFYLALKALGINDIPAIFDVVTLNEDYAKKMTVINRLFENWNELKEMIALNLSDEKISAEIGKVIAAVNEQAEYEGEELVNFIKLLISAGAETTASLIASSVYLILSDVAAAAAVKSGEQAETSFLNEVLRLYSPAQFTFRKTIHATVLAGAEIPAAAAVAVAVGGANRDPAIFSNPAQFNLNRSERHIAFGYGSHRCLGEHLAMYLAKSFIRQFNAVSIGLQYDNVFKVDNGLFAFKISEIRVKLR